MNAKVVLATVEGSEKTKEKKKEKEDDRKGKKKIELTDEMT